MAPHSPQTFGAPRHSRGAPLTRTFATLVNGLLDAGLVIERVVEPMPGEPWLRSHPQAGDERRRPMFLLVRARKP